MEFLEEQFQQARSTALTGSSHEKDNLQQSYKAAKNRAGKSQRSYNMNLKLDACTAPKDISKSACQSMRCRTGAWSWQLFNRTWRGVPGMLTLSGWSKLESLKFGRFWITARRRLAGWFGAGICIGGAQERPRGLRIGAGVPLGPCPYSWTSLVKSDISRLAP